MNIACSMPFRDFVYLLIDNLRFLELLAILSSASAATFSVVQVRRASKKRLAQQRTMLERMKSAFSNDGGEQGKWNQSADTSKQTGLLGSPRDISIRNAVEVVQEKSRPGSA